MPEQQKKHKYLISVEETDSPGHYAVLIEGRGFLGTIFADSQYEAEEKLLDYLANELTDREID